MDFINVNRYENKENYPETDHIHVNSTENGNNDFYMADIPISSTSNNRLIRYSRRSMREPEIAMSTVMESGNGFYRTVQGTSRTRSTTRRLPVAMVAACEMCWAGFSDMTELWIHARWEHADEERLVCPIRECGKRFARRVLSRRHAKHHLGVRYMLTMDGERLAIPTVLRPYTCEVCGRLSRSRNGLEKHLDENHPEAERYTCGVCYLIARDVPSLVRHVGRRHPEMVRAAKSGRRCDLCAKWCGDAGAVQNHRTVHGVA